MMVSMAVNRFQPAIADEDLLAAFANLGHTGPDELDDLDALRTWWVSLGAGLPAPAADEDLAALRGVRAAVQAMALTNNGVTTDVDASALESLPFRLHVGDRPGLRAPEDSGLVGTVVASVASAL